jgi:hypothetical protein
MNFPNFPLYPSLKSGEFKELSEAQKDELFDIIKEIADEKQEQIYALIRAYHLDHDNQIQDLPYGGKILKSGIKFDIDCLPSNLQSILYQFVKIK